VRPNGGVGWIFGIRGLQAVAASVIVGIPPAHGVKGGPWLDVGCGNGAFTELIMAKTVPCASPGHRSVGWTARLCAKAQRDRHGRIPQGRRDGVAVPCPQFRCRDHGAGDLLRPRTGEGCRRIEVERGSVDFDDFRGAATPGASTGPLFASMPAGDIARIKTRFRAHLRQDGAGRVSYRGFANAIRGRVPG